MMYVVENTGGNLSRHRRPVGAASLLPPPLSTFDPLRCLRSPALEIIGISSRDPNNSGNPVRLSVFLSFFFFLFSSII
jgi:hypothetical protein